MWKVAHLLVVGVLNDLKKRGFVDDFRSRNKKKFVVGLTSTRDQERLNF